MKELLERWAILEPNKVPPSILANITDCNSEVIMMRIQWAVQQAIIEKGWYFQITYNREYYSVEMGLRHPSPRFTKNYESLVEALLTSYLAELEASVNP